MLRYIFHIMCLCVTAGILCWCYYRYSQDEDVSYVLFKRFNSDANDIAPAISICFVNPFLKKKLSTIGGGQINTTYYSLYLQGKIKDKQMMGMVYDNVTVSMNDFLVGIKIFAADHTTHWYNHSCIEEGSSRYIPTTYIGFRSGRAKCFAVDIPFVKDNKITSLEIAMKNKIFPNRIRPHVVDYNVRNPNWSGFLVLFHYPEQLLCHYQFKNQFGFAKEENEEL